MTNIKPLPQTQPGYIYQIQVLSSPTELKYARACVYDTEAEAIEMFVEDTQSMEKLYGAKGEFGADGGYVMRVAGCCVYFFILQVGPGEELSQGYHFRDAVAAVLEESNA